MNELKCPHCHADNPEGSEFCRKCGEPLNSEIVCPQCGHTNLPDSAFCNKCGHSLTESTAAPQTKVTAPSESPKTTPTEPTSFIDDRYQVIKKLGEGGKKKAYLVHDSVLDRDVAFALIKTENLDKKAEAIEHLDFAIKEFREMKMQPSLERALRRKDILKA